MSVPDEGYSRDVSCALILISTFSFNVAWMVLYQIYVLCWSEILNSRHDGHWLTITTWIRRNFSNTTHLFECKHCMNNQKISDTVPEKPLNCLFAYILDHPSLITVVLLVIIYFTYYVTNLCFLRVRRGRDRMVVGFASAYHHWCCEFESRSGRGVQHYVIKLSVSSTNKTDRHDITEILLKVALITIKQTSKHVATYFGKYTNLADLMLLEIVSNPICNVKYYLYNKYA